MLLALGAFVEGEVGEVGEAVEVGEVEEEEGTKLELRYFLRTVFHSVCA